MALDRDAVQRAVALLKQSSAAELEISEGGLTVRVRRLPAGAVAAAPPAAEGAESSAEGLEVAVEAPEVPSDAPAPARSYIEARMVGLFHRGRGPDSEPLVKPGDIVREGWPVATIEALRKLTEVRSPLDGEIAEVLVEDGQPVQYGQKLFAVNVTPERG